MTHRTGAIVLLALGWLAGCATAPALEDGKRYGLDWHDSQEAIKQGEERPALAYYEYVARFYEERGQLVTPAGRTGMSRR